MTAASCIGITSIASVITATIRRKTISYLYINLNKIRTLIHCCTSLVHLTLDVQYKLSDNGTILCSYTLVLGHL